MILSLSLVMEAAEIYSVSSQGEGKGRGKGFDNHHGHGHGRRIGSRIGNGTWIEPSSQDTATITTR